MEKKRKIEDYIEYDETSPTGLRWIKSSSNRVKVGSVCGSVRGIKYSVVHWDYRNLLCHRVVYYLHYGIWSDSKSHINHIDNNHLNNRIDNLELISSRENSGHQNRKMMSNSTTGVRGVCKDYKGKYKVQYSGKYLGLVDTLEEGRRLYLEEVERREKKPKNS